MPIQFLNPEGLFSPGSYHQVAVATGGRTIFLSGQIAVNAEGTLVGKGDLAAQAEQAYLNVAAALKGAGATFNDVAKLTVYVVNWSPDKMQQLVAGAMRVAEKSGFDPRKAITLIGVAALTSPEHLIEVEAIAVLP